MDGGESKRFALIGLSIFTLDRVVISLINVLGLRDFRFLFVDSITLTVVVFNWALPLIVVFLVEGRGWGTLGLKVRKERYAIYTVLPLLGLVLPALFVGIDRALVVELAEQLAYIGLAEEFFFRGYLMTRLCDWLGDYRGLLLNGAVFSLTHVISLVSRYGFASPVWEATMGLQTLVGGLLLGYIYLRSGDIVPCSIVHISMNAYLSRLA
jgi:membrane protease YdiL (CAAX protease family)